MIYEQMMEVSADGMIVLEMHLKRKKQRFIKKSSIGRPARLTWNMWDEMLPFILLKGRQESVVWLVGGRLSGRGCDSSYPRIEYTEATFEEGKSIYPAVLKY